MRPQGAAAAMGQLGGGRSVRPVAGALLLALHLAGLLERCQASFAAGPTGAATTKADSQDPSRLLEHSQGAEQPANNEKPFGEYSRQWSIWPARSG